MKKKMTNKDISRLAKIIEKSSGIKPTSMLVPIEEFNHEYNIARMWRDKETTTLFAKYWSRIDPNDLRYSVRMIFDDMDDLISNYNESCGTSIRREDVEKYIILI